MRENAERSVRFSFIIEAIKADFKIEVSNDDIESEYKKMAEVNKVDIKEIRKYYMQSENKNQMPTPLLVEFAIIAAILPHDSRQAIQIEGQ